MFTVLPEGEHDFAVAFHPGILANLHASFDFVLAKLADDETAARAQPEAFKDDPLAEFEWRAGTGSRWRDDKHDVVNAARARYGQFDRYAANGDGSVALKVDDEDLDVLIRAANTVRNVIATEADVTSEEQHEALLKREEPTSVMFVVCSLVVETAASAQLARLRADDTPAENER